MSKQHVGQRFNTNDLPAELLSQLSRPKKSDSEETRIVEVIEAYEGVANIDEIVVGLYRKFGIVTKNRRYLANKLWRMSTHGHIERAAGKEGIYKVMKKEVK